MKKRILTTANSKKRSDSRITKRTRRVRVGITRPYGYLIFSDGTLETEEERKKRLARLDAMTLKFFQMAHEDLNRR